MRSKAKRAFYYDVSASSLGGFLETPEQAIIPSQASVTLPPVGGHAAHKTFAFDFQQVVSCRLAHTRVSGRPHEPIEGHEFESEGSWSVLVTSVVEGLNILEVVTAERIVAQLSMHFYGGNHYPHVSLVGSKFEGLKIAGKDAKVRHNSTLMNVDMKGDASHSRIHWPVFKDEGSDQATRLLDPLQREISDGPYGWLVQRYGWMKSAKTFGDDGMVVCSLVDGFHNKEELAGRNFGHVIEIPDFGRVFLGELVATKKSVHLAMVRAELGCNVSGNVSGGTAGGGGSKLPPKDGG